MADKDGYTFQYMDRLSEAAKRIVIPIPKTWGLATDCEDYLLTGICSIHVNHVMRFQEDGVRWMVANAKNILLADEMGLGKTLETLLFINVTNPDKILVVCPNNAKLVWRRHFEQLAVRKYEIEMASTSLCMGFGEVMIINYEAATKWDACLRLVPWNLIVYDEGQYLKNPSAKRSKACYSLEGDKKIIITGTPIVNYPYEIFPLIHWLDPENHPDIRRHERMYGGRGNNKFGHNLNRLNSLLRSTIMLRRMKKDVLPQLPKKHRTLIEYEVPEGLQEMIDKEKELWNKVKNEDLTAAQAQMFSAMANESKESDVALTDVDWAAIVNGMLLTKRTAFTEMSRVAHLIGVAKIPFAIEHIENLLESTDKVVVFGHHRDVLTAIAKHFNGVLLLGGNSDQPQAVRDAEDKYNTDDNARVFVCGMKIAQSFSLQKGSTVLFIEETWIPGDYTQSEDRLHGIGRGDHSEKRLQIQHIVFEDSLDAEKAQLGMAKQKSIDRAMNR